jgi:hypothetical protein
MALTSTATGPAVPRSDTLAEEQRRQGVLRALGGRAWQQRLAPLAQHMAGRRLIRARSDRGAALAFSALNLDVLREALLRLLQHSPEQAHLLVAVALSDSDEDTPTDVRGVAAELGIAHVEVLGELHKALAALARHYEDLAFAASVAGEGEEPGLAGAVHAQSAGRGAGSPHVRGGERSASRLRRGACGKLAAGRRSSTSKKATK